VLRDRASTVTGILNGVDYDEWSPQTDKFTAGKILAAGSFRQSEVQAGSAGAFGIKNADPNLPVIGIVSRFAAQKGFDLIAQIMDRLAREEMIMVALGTGRQDLRRNVPAPQQTVPQQDCVKVAYDNAIAHKIEAGADMFLMPSRYEPCGLNQIYSLKYGTVPIVRATGGLDDTIEPWDARTGKGTGFKFTEYNGEALLLTIKQALQAFRDQTSWQVLMRNGMAKDFSWNASAREYGKDLRARQADAHCGLGRHITIIQRRYEPPVPGGVDFVSNPCFFMRARTFFISSMLIPFVRRHPRSWLTASSYTRTQVTASRGSASPK
jgi:starch synthase